MKNSILWFMACLILNTLSGFAQFKNKDDKRSTIESSDLQIGYSKTTSIVFPYAIKSVDRGSGEVLVQKAKGVENILLIKAGQPNFAQTNLTVVTADGKLYSYVLNYEEHCPILNIVEGRSKDSNQEVLFLSEKENQKQIQEYASLALSKKKKIKGLNENRFYVRLQVNGIFIHEDVMYFRLVLCNASRINYDIDQLRFFIRDQKKSKRTASQEIEILPLFATSDVKTIPDESEVTVVIALPKFTIPEKKYFAVQLIEKNGGRDIELDVKNGELDHFEVLTSL
ncbi:conjugative transposon protein TraN [Flavobacterium granuli]|uniref:Conjugative transposon TraN protein n=1 Tax=Flavobacterium granuli TaxID=280093 RepID=A0ABU1S4L7_9FLAO|nr:conjugative transposon protein TraN [Flavobacterium granuli]MDR6845565.1 conjugative transposon TraN protein [Flavobacterium granuli]